MRESIFIAWGGNWTLAKIVGDKLEKLGFSTIVGGGMPDKLYVGSYILDQMKQCSHAVILSEPKQNSTSGIFSHNLMFEWGFLTAKLPSTNLHAFLIDTAHKDLPSDLAGFWSTTVRRNGRDNESVADEIVNVFLDEYNRIEPLSKLKMIHEYHRLMIIITNYSISPDCSVSQICNYILHSLNIAIYYNEFDSYYEKVQAILTDSKIIKAVIQVVEAIYMLYKKTFNMTTLLDTSSYVEIALMLNSDFDELCDDAELQSWCKIISKSHLSICNMLLAKNPSNDDDTRWAYYQKAIDISMDVLNEIESVAKYSKDDEKYCKLFVSYCTRDIAECYVQLGIEPKAIEFVNKTVTARQELFVYYKQIYPTDTTIINKLAQEYYFGLLLKIKYEKDVIQRDIIIKAIGSYFDTLDSQFKLNNLLLYEMRELYEALISKKPKSKLLILSEKIEKHLR